MLAVLLALSLVVVVVLAVVLVRSNSELDRQRTVVRDLSAERDDALAAREAAAADAAAAERARDEAVERANRTRRDSAEVARRLSEAVADRDALVAERDGARAELDALRSTVEETDAGRRAAEAAVAEAQAALADQTGATADAREALAAETAARVAAETALAADADRATGPAPAAAAGEDLAGVLWALTRSRGARVWMTSVALDPTATPPIDAADNPVLEVLEVEATAVREEAGTDVEVSWSGPADLGPLTSALVAGAGVELASAAAKVAETATLSVVVGDDEVIVRLDARGADDESTAVDAPALAPVADGDGGYRLPRR